MSLEFPALEGRFFTTSATWEAQFVTYYNQIWIDIRDVGSTPGQKDPLEEEMAPHSSILAWKIPWTEEPGGLQSMGSQRVGHDLLIFLQKPSRDFL